MSAKSGDGGGEKQVGVRVDESLVDAFDRVLLEAKVDGDLPMDYNRSDALRDFMEAAVENPDVLLDLVDVEDEDSDE